MGLLIKIEEEREEGERRGDPLSISFLLLSLLLDSQNCAAPWHSQFCSVTSWKLIIVRLVCINAWRHFNKLINSATSIDLFLFSCQFPGFYNFLFVQVGSKSSTLFVSLTFFFKCSSTGVCLLIISMFSVITLWQCWLLVNSWTVDQCTAGSHLLKCCLALSILT